MTARTTNFEFQTYDPNPASNLMLKRLARATTKVIPLINGPAQVRWRMVAAEPEAVVSAWANSPEAHTKPFLRAGRRVSREIQQALRLWLPYVWFSHADCWEDPALATQMLFYAASPAYTAVSKMQFTYELLDWAALRRMHERSRDQLRIWSNAWFVHVSERADPAVARFFHSMRRAEWERTFARRHDEFDRLLERERAVIERFLGALESRRPPVEMPGFAESVSVPLGRLFAGSDCRELLPVLCAAANRAVDEGSTGWSAIQLTGEYLTNTRPVRPISWLDEAAA